MNLIHKPLQSLTKEEFDEAYEELINKYPNKSFNKNLIIQTALFYKQITEQKVEELLKIVEDDKTN
jgi:hypothetical protein